MAESTVVTVRADVGVIDRVRNYVAATAGETLCGVVSRALRAEIERLEKEGGGPFEQRTKNLNGSKLGVK